MHRFLRGASALALALALLPASLAGCGGGAEVGDIQDTEEAKAADQAGQKAMEEYMRNQGKAAR